MRAGTILALALLAAACGSSPARPTPSPQPPPVPIDPGVTGQKCNDGDAYVVGPYTYANNQWGKSKVPAGQSFRQCLQTREVNGQAQYGWTFQWPGHDPSVYAYPEIMFGWTPWGGGSSSDARFPMAVDRMPRVTVDYDLESTMAGFYNLAPEVWVTRTAGAGAARPADIATEIMFWLDYDAASGPAGRVVATVLVDGVSYDLYKADVRNDAAAWTYLAYKGPRGRLSGSFRVDAFVNDAMARGYVPRTGHVAGIEFGNECSGGTGTTWVRRYDVRIGG